MNGKTWTGGMTSINKYACAGGEITVQLGAIPNVASTPFLEVWVKTGQTDCQNGERITALVEENRCHKVDIHDQTQLRNAPFTNVKVNLHDGICDGDEAFGGTRSIFFLALQSQNSAETATSFGVLPLPIRTLLPDSPTNVNAESGQTQIPIRWTLPAQQVYGYEVVVDLGTDQTSLADDQDAGSGPCPSSKLKKNQEWNPTLEPIPGIFTVTEHTSGHEAVLDGEKLGGSATKQYFPASVIVLDQAGNASLLSEVACLHYVQTTGFWERYKQNGGTADPGYACSVPGAPRPSTGRTWLGLCFAVALLGWRHRARAGRRSANNDGRRDRMPGRFSGPLRLDRR